MAIKYHFMFLGLALLFSLYYLYTPWLLFPPFILLSIFFGGSLALFKGSYELRRAETQPRPPKPIPHPFLYHLKVYPPNTLHPTLVSANIDDRIHRVIDLVLLHHVRPFYSIVAPNEKKFFDSLIPEVWKVLQVLLKRISQVDTLKLISHDSIEVLRQHFLSFHGFSGSGGGARPGSAGTRSFPNLRSYPYLENEEKELEFLRKAIDVLLCVCLDREYLECTPIRIIIREFLVCNIVHPMIERVCEPDYINQKLLRYLVQREELTKVSQKRYAHSETYEDFMQHIKKCDDINELTHIRSSIITDIMQAKAVQRMKEASSTGLRVSSLPVAVSADKAKSLMERDLKLYITQLTTAKGACERRIRALGGEDYQQDQVETEQVKPDFPRPIPFETIMKSEKCLDYFERFLNKCNYGNRLAFLREAKGLKTGPGSTTVSLQSIKNIYAKYLALGAECPIYPPSELLEELERAMEIEASSYVPPATSSPVPSPPSLPLSSLPSSPNSSLSSLSSHSSAHAHSPSSPGSPSLVALINIQRLIHQELHEQHYETFLYSEDFKEFMEGETESDDKALALSFSGISGSALEDNVYQKRLTALKRKLSDKDSVIASYKAETGAAKENTATSRVKRLEKGRTELQEEIKQLQRYIEHTEEWFGTQGKWNVEISNVDVAEDAGNDKDPLMILVVHRPPVNRRAMSRNTFTSYSPFVEESFCSSESIEEDMDSGVIALSTHENPEVPKSAGWVLGRRLSEFQELHAKIRPISPHLTFPPLPRKSFIPFLKREDQQYWDKYRHALQIYVNTVLHDQFLVESQDVFNFLSPASADLHKDEKPSRLLLLRETKEESILDSVSSLISEVFELQGKSRILRKQLYDLAQLTFGRGLEGELQDLMKWLVSEPMLVYYIETFQESMWPGGEIGEAPPDRSDAEKELTKEQAKEHFMKCIPLTLQTVLGQRNCNLGFLKMFTAFQDRNANKQLFYSCFELLMYAVIPELETVEMMEDGGVH